MCFQKTVYGGHDVYIYDETDSTNLRLKENAECLSNGSVILAHSQTAGRGRMQRTWLSRKGAGAWFSVLVKPDFEVQAAKTPDLVFVAALSVYKALHKLTGAEFRIKWPNDLVLNGKKICGIMCEMRNRDTSLDYAVLGIGINLNESDFPPELPHASSVYKETGIEIENTSAVQAFLNEFDRDFETWRACGLKAILKDISTVSATIGNYVTAFSDNFSLSGIAEGFTDDGALIVRNDNGKHIVRYGDVSVRGVMGYAE